MPDPLRPQRYRILDTPVDAVDMDGALAFVDRAVRGDGPPGYILAVNPEKVYALRESPALAAFFDAAALLIPDGVGMVLALRCLAGVRIGRVPGADLMQQICAAAPDKRHRIFIYGAKEEVNAKACAILSKRYPGIAIVGRANGYVPEADMPQLIDAINASGTEILFVALGSPLQETWIQQYLPQLEIRIVQGIGGTLDTLAGNVKRAPMIFQRLGLEWFYRLAKQPSRGGRQLRLLNFVLDVLKAKLVTPSRVLRPPAP